MRRKPRRAMAPVFKRYDQDQLILLPPSVDELVPSNHIVRVVDGIIRKMDLCPLLDKYKGGGSSSYHPEMMLKIFIFSYINQIYSSRQIAKALRENIAFMWLSAGNRPDFRTLNRFRSSKLKEVINDMFAQMLDILIEKGLVKFENYFIDGSKFEADANRHKIVWSKSTKRYKNIAQEHIKELLNRIDEINEKENKKYGDSDLEELRANELITSKDIEKIVSDLNEELKDKKNKDESDKEVNRIKKKIEEEYLPKLKKYENQEEISAGKNSYSVTDTDAAAMRMKDERLLPAYNVQLGTENQFILNYSIHDNGGDSGLFKPHMEKFEQLTGVLPSAVIADSAYGSEENYKYCEEKEIDAFLKYNTFHKEKTRKYKNDISRKENMKYNIFRDEYVCANESKLKFVRELAKTSRNGFKYIVKKYECADCTACLKAHLCKKTENNKSIEVNKRLDNYRRNARNLLCSDKGAFLCKMRSIEVESVFGNIKSNMKFRRFHLRSALNVNCEMGLISMAHNFKKMLNIKHKTALSQFHALVFQYFEFSYF